MPPPTTSATPEIIYLTLAVEDADEFGGFLYL